MQRLDSSCSEGYPRSSPQGRGSRDRHLSKAAIYHYFDVKDDLVRCVLGGWAERSAVPFQEIAHSGDDPETRLRRFIALRISQMVDDSNLFALSIQEEHHLPEPDREDFRRSKRTRASRPPATRSRTSRVTSRPSASTPTRSPTPSIADARAAASPANCTVTRGTTTATCGNGSAVGAPRTAWPDAASRPPPAWAVTAGS